MAFASENPNSQDLLPIHVAPPTAPETGADRALARMVERMTAISPRSGAEALRELRAAFPDAPLALRVAALGMVMRQHRGTSAIPR
jgi:hypothetical protein